MNKRFCLIIILFLLFPRPASAIVTQKTDSFDGTTVVQSENSLDTEAIKDIMFAEFLPKNKNPFFALYLFTVKNEWWFYSRSNIELKIDNKDEIISLPIIDTGSKMISTHSLMTNCIANVDANIVSKIANANEITLRVHFNNKPAHVFSLPRGILEEWKSIIAKQQTANTYSY